MKILLTGANGYIGQRLMPILLKNGHEVIACVRDKTRLSNFADEKGVSVVELDLLDPVNDGLLPQDIDVAFYLVHSMSGKGDFSKKELKSAENFLSYLKPTSTRQIIYLSGIVNSDELSKHLESRYAVEKCLGQSDIPLTVLRAAIIVGSGSASFEIIRDLVEKLPVMVAPRWLNTKCQPIGIRNIIAILNGVIGREETYDQSFDVGGPEVLTYKEMLLQFAEVRGLKRWIFTLPVMTPRLSSYWLYFITSTSYPLAINLVNSMKVDVIAEDDRLVKLLNIDLIDYRGAVQLAFKRIEQNMVVSSWKDAFVASDIKKDLMKYINVPDYGCFKDIKERTISKGQYEQVIGNIWRIGGDTGWYYADTLWKIRGYMDKLVGGVGLRRGRTSMATINPGDALDFWRVLAADRDEGRLLLIAEMKLPGDAWLEFKIEPLQSDQYKVIQTATFRPLGLMGRLYWYLVLPFHFFIFDGMINRLIKTPLPSSLVTQQD